MYIQYFLILVLLFIAGCYLEPESIVENESSAEITYTDLVAQPEDFGDFKLLYGPTVTYKNLEIVFNESKLFDIIIDDLNKRFILKSDIYVVFIECDNSNAYYSNGTIVMCYDFVDSIGNDFLKIYNKKDNFDKKSNIYVKDPNVATLYTTIFFFYHELGHALIDNYDLSITGREEDVADQIATYMLTNDEEIVLNSAIYFKLAGFGKRYKDLAFSDEHSLDLQRYYQIICWLYGKNPEKYSYLVDYLELPEDRAIRCNDEYIKMEKAVVSLLGDYLK